MVLLVCSSFLECLSATYVEARYVLCRMSNTIYINNNNRFVPYHIVAHLQSCTLVPTTNYLDLRALGNMRTCATVHIRYPGVFIEVPRSKRPTIQRIQQTIKIASIMLSPIQGPVGRNMQRSHRIERCNGLVAPPSRSLEKRSRSNLQLLSYNGSAVCYTLVKGSTTISEFNILRTRLRRGKISCAHGSIASTLFYHEIVI